MPPRSHGRPPSATPWPWLLLLACLATRSPRAASLPDPNQFVGVVLGVAPSKGSSTITNEVIRLQAQGAGIGGRADQGFFLHTSVGTNDFDLKVRVRDLQADALTARAGLMVRDDATNTAAMAAILATPAMNGIQFLARASSDGVAVATGSFPGNLPNGWLRLQRSNEVFRGFASLDGRRWTLLGRASLSFTNALVGLAASSARTNDSATAEFANWADATGDSEDPTPPLFEPAGPSSRRTALAITEINYNPPSVPGGGEFPHQFVEVFNSDFTAKELGGHRLDGASLSFVFPKNFVLPAGGYVVVAKDPAALHAQHPTLPVASTLGPWEGDLARDHDTVRLWSPFGALLLEVSFEDHAPWPLAPDGEGHTLVLARPSWGETDPRAWAASPEFLGSPGRADAVDGDPRAGLRIAEVYDRRGGGVAPFVELFNAGVDPAPLAGLVVTGPLDSRDREMPLPDQTLPPGGRIIVAIPPANPTLPSPLFLREPAGGRAWDVVSFGGADTNAAFGRANLDRAELRRLTAPTPGLPNAPARRPRLVISEVMYQPITGRDDDQYVEIWNPGSEAVSLAGWRLTGGVSLDFPSRRSLAPGERTVVARNSARLKLTYPGLSADRILGEFNGRLGARGERLSLLDETGAVEFGFTYRSGGEWPSLADGGGSSLELLHPDLDPDLGSSWAASDESGRAAWQTYEVTGKLEGGTGSISDVRLLLLDAGETLVDDVEAFVVGSTNLLANPSFEGGLLGWTPGGTHERSGLATNEGFGGSAQALQLRASDRGDNGINSVRASLRTGMRDGTNATLRLRARWLAGTRDLLLRVKGNYLELPIRLDVPEDLGTPGAPNSHTLDTPRPALADLTHFPVLPAEGQPVRITVRVSGDPGTARPQLRYRLDPATELAPPLPMNDAGLEGDRVAGDGVYTAVLPGLAARSMVAFHVTLGAEGAEFRAPRTTANREALVRWGETQPAGNLGVYRIWISRATESRWNSRAKLHNGDLDGTFVYGASRAVYGLGALYSGSPFVSPGYNGPTGSALCGYVLHFPADDAFLGEQDFVMDWPIRDDTRQLEQRAYEFAAEIGLPYLHRRFVHLFVNSSKRGILYEDTQQPGSAYLRNWSAGDDNGNLHKIEDWFEFSSSGEMEVNTDAQLADFRRSDGSKNTARYRWNFRPRSVQGSSHDLSALYRLVDAATPPSSLLEFERDLEREMDVDEWAGIFAVEHAVGNWDSFGYSRGKNMYAYRPKLSPWRLFIWDIDFVLSAGGQGPGDWPFNTIDPTIAKLYAHPPFQRAYWRAVKKLVNGPMRPERFNDRTEAVRLGLLDNGVSSSSLTAARNFVRDQRDNLLNQLANVDRPFSAEATPPGVTTTDPVLLLEGQGPLEMTGLRVNDQILPIGWSQPDRWYVLIPLQAGRNAITLAPVDAAGQTIGTARTRTVTLTQPLLPEAQRIVINEIHTSPKTPGGAFVELHNPSLVQSLDLSGLQFLGLGRYEFPPNTALGPDQFLTLGTSLPGFQTEFGRNQFPQALLPWTPSPQGETLALVRPAHGTTQAVTLTAVTYRPDGPWPGVLPGRSLQLRDAARGEDDRVGDWAVYAPPTNSSPWKEFSVTGTAGGTNLLLYVSSFPPSLAPADLVGRWVGSLSSFGFDFAVEFSRDAAGMLSGRFYGGDTSVDPDLFSSELAAVSADATGAIRFTWQEINGRFSGRIDATGNRATGSFTFDNGSSPFTLTRQRPAGSALLDDLKLTRDGDPTNLLRNGDFQTDLGTEWQVDTSYAASGRVTLPATSPAGSPESALHLEGILGGTGTTTNAVSQSISGVVTGATYRLSGRYQARKAQGLVIGLEGGPFFTADLRPRTGSGPDATPGRPNSVAESLPPIPRLWVNEIQPENLEGPRDVSGRVEPWLEVHNSEANAASLDGYFLSDDPLAPRRWAFPAGTRVPPGGFLLVWLDGQPEEGSPEAPHAAFRPSARDGVVVLSHAEGEGTLPVDFLHYTEVPAGRTFGHQPETWVHADGVLPRPTPGLSNGSLVEPPVLRINEWMATNDGSVRDPADLDDDDWFELYNPGSTAVDLTGWLLTDNAGSPTKFRVPSGYRVPAGGFLLVWADEELGQNQPSRADLHVNFRLAGGGEEILLSRPDGTVMDHVVFGPMNDGVSQGRKPDGATGTNYVLLASPTPGNSNTVSAPAHPDIRTVERRADGSLHVGFVSEPGARYRLRTKDALDQPTWVPAAASITANGALAELIWPFDEAPHRFLQVERMP